MPNRTSSANKSRHHFPSLTPLRSQHTPPATTLELQLSTSSTSIIQSRFVWRLSEFWTRSIKARSRRRRPSVPFIITKQTPASSSKPSTISSSRPFLRMLHSISLPFSPTSTTAYVVLLMLSTTCCSLCSASPCQSHNWWDPVKDKCIPCTDCQGQSIVLRPCQLHRDTICGSIYDLEIDWMVLTKTEPNWKERRKSGNGDFKLQSQFTHEDLQQLQLLQQQQQQQQQQEEETISLDWQTAALFFAVLACLLFFIVAACILIQHMRQWRRMERRLDQDVEELSTKLMAKLAEVQNLEGGTFFIGNADILKGPATFQPQHVLLPEKPAKQHNERRVLKTLQPGNVYIEENGSKG